MRECLRMNVHDVGVCTERYVYACTCIYIVYQPVYMYASRQPARPRDRLFELCDGRTLAMFTTRRAVSPGFSFKRMLLLPRINTWLLQSTRDKSAL